MWQQVGTKPTICHEHEKYQNNRNSKWHGTNHNKGKPSFKYKHKTWKPNPRIWNVQDVRSNEILLWK